jgi:hypothetical protein
VLRVVGVMRRKQNGEGGGGLTDLRRREEEEWWGPAGQHVEEQGDLAHGRAAPMRWGWVALGGAVRGARGREQQRRADETGEGDDI